MIAWDLDGNGTFETAGQTATFSAAGLDAPLTRTISVRATSPTGFSVDDATVRVIWDFHGFKSFLDLPAVNDATAGGEVTLKFSLTGDQGLDIFRAGYPASASYPCGTAPPTDATEPVTTTGGSRLRYDARKDEYALVWTT